MKNDLPQPFLVVGLVRNLVGLALWLAVAVALIAFGDWLARIIGFVMLGLYAIPFSIGLYRWARHRSA